MKDFVLMAAIVVIVAYLTFAIVLTIYEKLSNRPFKAWEPPPIDFNIKRSEREIYEMEQMALRRASRSELDKVIDEVRETGTPMKDPCGCGFVIEREGLGDEQHLIVRGEDGFKERLYGFQSYYERVLIELREKLTRFQETIAKASRGETCVDPFGYGCQFERSGDELLITRLSLKESWEEYAKNHSYPLMPLFQRRRSLSDGYEYIKQAAKELYDERYPPQERDPNPDTLGHPGWH
jgi:hypothetical protein